LTRADRAFAGCACDIFAISFGFEADAFSFLTLARRAFGSALFFSLHAAESPCLFCGAAAFIACLPRVDDRLPADHLLAMAPGAITPENGD
jgi:hypothetical protein